MDRQLFLDEFRPFRRGELALARKLCEDPLFLAPRHADLLRYALRLAQLSSIGPERNALVDPIGSFRLRLLQLLAPVLPTDTAAMDASDLYELLPRVVRLVDDARAYVTEAGLASEKALDDELSDKKLVLVMAGAAGSGYAYLGALERLERMGMQPSYLVGCSMGAILGVIRARSVHFEVEAVHEELRLLRADGVFRAPDLTTRYGVPAALRLDLRRALGSLFTQGGQLQPLADLAIPTDVMATGLGPGSLTGAPADFGTLIEVPDVEALSRLGARQVARLVAGLVSLAMSRRVLVPIFFGGTAETRSLSALDAAGFSAAIPGLLHYDLPRDDEQGAAVLDPLFREHSLLGIVDGALTTAIPARYAFEQIEDGRLGSRHTAIVVLDAVTRAGGANALLAPFLRAVTASSHHDRAFCDLHVTFRKAPPVLDLFPSEARLRRATEQGEVEFEREAAALKAFTAPLPRWEALAGDFRD